MDFLDAILIVVIVGSAAHGLRVGAAVQLTTLIGVLAGLVLGALLVVEIVPHVSGAPTKALVTVGLLVFPAAVLGGFGRQVGVRAWRAIRRIRFGLVDSFAGALIAVAGTALVLWLFASVLVNAPSPLVVKEIDNSAVLRGIDAVMPPVPDAFARIEAYLAETGFPQVIVGLVPGPTGSVPLASSPEVASVVSEDGASTVKVVAFGCGEELEGSGFAVGPGLVVTNAHVIAGTSEISVYAQNGRHSAAVPVLFDPRFDLAILRVGPLGVTPLSIDRGFVSRGTPVVFLGYPEGGSFNAQPAGILSKFTAEGRDIYAESLTIRQVYELEAAVRPGNSGGPVVTLDGEVVGVVFSRSTSNPDVGFALASPGVASRVAQAEGAPSPTGTGQCVGG
jgi:S1-C subfamily serine protease